MGRVIQKHVRKKLDEWAKVQEKLKRLENAKNKKLDPLIAAHNQEVKPIIENFDKKSKPVREQGFDLELEIRAMIEADRDIDGNPKPILIATEKATASVEKKEGARTVDPKKYFDSVKVKGAKFWDSVKILIGKAQPLVGDDQLDQISDKKTDYVSSIKLK